MYILGINAYHGGASACLIKDGQLIAAAEEERFKRVKYWAGFPVEAIRYCLAEAGITAYDLDHIGISRNPSAHLYNKVLFALTRRPHLNLLKDRLANAARVRDIKKVFCERLGVDASSVKAEFHHIEHHRAHMASAFFVSPFNEAAVLSVDGFGDFVSTMLGYGSGTKLEVLDYVLYPHSLGIFYTAFTQYLGFPKYGDEGKAMGMTSYGQPVFLDECRRIVRVRERGLFELGLDYFVHHVRGTDMTWDDGAPTMDNAYSRKLVDQFGPPRKPRSGVTSHYANIAASMQAMLEEAMFHILNILYQKTKQTNLCMAGGVALNSVVNGMIRQRTPFKELFIQPAAGDAGTSLGAAYYIYHHLLGKPRTFVMKHPYTGPRFSNSKIEEVLNRYNLHYKTYDYDEIAKIGAQIVADGLVLGWFQGRMEWGPRALGNRSIIADPRREDMKDILNARVKHREKFRPFAPSILLEAVGDYFEQTYPEPFMLQVYKVREDKRKVIPAVTHVDGTGRLQTVDREINPLYWQLIKEFENLTGVPVVLNTSFNENEPIVCTPKEAVECFLRTKMDALIIGNYLVRK